MPTIKHWNWQQPDWPEFRYDAAALETLEREFLRQSGVFAGAVRHVGDEEKSLLTVELISDEALKTSEIEGELLNRDSLQSSIRRNFGLATDNRRIPPAEQGIAEMMVDLYRNFSAPLSNSTLFAWHRMPMSGRRDLTEIGRFRRGETPMQVVSGPIHAPTVHFEAPPASAVSAEMKRFIAWFNRTKPGGANPLPPLTRAGIAHLYFVSIHPFEDGNGRIGRALVEKALSESQGEPTLIALSHVINSRRKAYYEALEKSNKTNEITDWLLYFANVILSANAHAQRLLDFLIEKTKLFDRFRGILNERQTKVIARMFREGPEGFKGGLSAENYIRITGASRATATRDLHDLVEKGAMLRQGALKSTRYFLNLPGFTG
jgi:Fic family protein